MAQVGLLEDNPRIAKLCATMLHYAGHAVTHYQHPRDCLQALIAGTVPLLRAYDEQGAALPIDILVLDLYIPEIAGVEVLQRLQAYPPTARLPLVLCTAATRGEIAQAVQVAPHAVVVEKPFKLQVLTSAITTSLQQATVRRGALQYEE